MISIVVPTVTGREHWLAECKASYAAHTTDYELIVVEDRPTCGQAWLEGADQCAGDFIHFSADDLQPHAGWWKAAVACTDLNLLPAPRIVNTDGSLQTCGGSDGFAELPTGTRTDFTRIPFMSRTQWDLIRPHVESFLRSAHYYTDNAISYGGMLEGIGTVVHRGFQFTHGFAQEKRGAGMPEPERMKHDHAAFAALVNS